MSKRQTLKGAGSVYIENFVLLGGGYVYWFIMTKITTTQVIGTSSALISIAVILSVIASMAIPSGLQRFIGRTYLRGDVAKSKRYVQASMILIAIGTIIAIFVMLLAHEWILGASIEPGLVYVSIILMSATSMTSLFRSVIISSLSKSAWLPIAATLAAAAKIATGILLIFIGLGALGVMVSFTVAPLLITIILGFILVKLFARVSPMNDIRLTVCTKDLFSSSVPTWVPMIVYTIGSHLGTIVIYESHGASQAAVFYISLSTVMALVTVLSAIYTVSYPVLSSMEDGRKRLAWRSIKMTLILSSPLSIALLFYSGEILSIFGHEYQNGALGFGILLLSIIPTLISLGISALAYSYGKYRDVLLIGLASNVPRPLLYLLLVPIFDNTGAALSYTVGALVGLVFSIVISRKLGLILFWRQILSLLLVPATIIFAFKIVNINFILSIALTIVLSYVIFLRLKILTEMDVKDSLMTLPDGVSMPILNFLYAISRKRANKI